MDQCFRNPPPADPCFEQLPHQGGLFTQEPAVTPHAPEIRIKDEFSLKWSPHGEIGSVGFLADLDFERVRPEVSEGERPWNALDALAEPAGWLFPKMGNDRSSEDGVVWIGEAGVVVGLQPTGRDENIVIGPYDDVPLGHADCRIPRMGES
jgi:hypothetical protein